MYWDNGNNTFWQALEGVARFGNIASKSDVEVGAKALETGIWGAWKNVQINMKDIRDADFKRSILSEAADIVNRAEQQCKKILSILEKRDQA